jgi:hypothetical protein
MGMLVRKFKIKMAHILAMNSSHMSRPVKDDLGLKVSEVYSIPCECGKVYTRQTGQPIERRCKEHDHHL